jgi:hypothetical protein
MLQMKITTKQQLLDLLKSSNIKQVVAKDIHVPDDLNDLKKSAIGLMKSGQVTAFVVVI